MFGEDLEALWAGSGNSFLLGRLHVASEQFRGDFRVISEMCQRSFAAAWKAFGELSRAVLQACDTSREIASE